MEAQSELAVQKAPTPNAVFSLIFCVRYVGIGLGVNVGNIVDSNVGKKVELLVGSTVRSDAGLWVGANEVVDVAFGVQVGESVVTEVGTEIGNNAVESPRLDGSDEGTAAGC